MFLGVGAGQTTGSGDPRSRSAVNAEVGRIQTSSRRNASAPTESLSEGVAARAMGPHLTVAPNLAVWFQNERCGGARCSDSALPQGMATFSVSRYSPCSPLTSSRIDTAADGMYTLSSH